MLELNTYTKWTIIFTLVFNYAVILIFPAFGPVMNHTTSISSGVIYGSFFLFFLLSSMFIKPQAFENTKYYIPTLIITCAILIISFTELSSTLKFVSFALLGYTTGRFTTLWCYMFLNKTSNKQIIKILVAAIFFSYFLLYLSNVIIPCLSLKQSTFFIVVLLFAMLISSNKTFIKPLNPSKDENITLHKKPYLLLLVIFLIYLTAGTTYTGIYPDLKKYALLERYYNVLPFLVAMICAWPIAKKWGYQSFLYLGICFLGFSFAFNMLTPSTLAYLLIQTTLQIGWAFMDVFVWIAGAYVSINNRNFHYLPIFVATFLTGTFVGSVITTLFKSFLLSNYGLISSLLTHLPIFIAVIFLGKVTEYLSQLNGDNSANNRTADVFDQEIFLALTKREKEVFHLLSKDMSNTDICETLFISPNTLKTHSRNIYRKIKVKNKRELVELVRKMGNEHFTL